MTALPEGARPANRREGYAIQAEVVRRSGDRPVGWKIAATSLDGQRHIGVDGPLAGRLLAGSVRPAGSTVSLRGNTMRLAEAEFAFRFARDVQSRGVVTVEEVLDAVDAVLPAIELPDSRYAAVVGAGGPQLIADMACAWSVIFGEERPAAWCACDLPGHRVTALLNGRTVESGLGANVLGDPRIALVWLATELQDAGAWLRAGDVVITGTCLAPVPISPGDDLTMDFGDLGAVRARFSA